jgi:quercetin dioxygenase-like cupin family protein
LEDQKVKNPQKYPRVITDLPEAIIQFKGVKAWALQGAEHQLVFFEMEPHTQVPEHSHDYPQWGIMLKGKMELTIDSKTYLIKEGDEYVIPAKAKHYATFLSKSRVIDFFSERTRYKTKPAK